MTVKKTFCSICDLPINSNNPEAKELDWRVYAPEGQDPNICKSCYIKLMTQLDKDVLELTGENAD